MRAQKKHNATHAGFAEVIKTTPNKRPSNEFARVGVVHLQGSALADVIVVEHGAFVLVICSPICRTRRGVDAAAVLRVGAHIFVHASLAHTTAALRRHHRLGRERGVERVEIPSVFVRKSLHVEERTRCLRPEMVLRHGARRVVLLRYGAERGGRGLIVAPYLVAKRPHHNRGVRAVTLDEVDHVAELVRHLEV